MSVVEAVAESSAPSRSDRRRNQCSGVSRPAGPSTWEEALFRVEGDRAFKDRDFHRLDAALTAQAAAARSGGVIDPGGDVVRDAYETIRSKGENMIRRRWSVARRASAVIVMSLGLVSTSAGASSAPPARHVPDVAHVTPGSDYLALGDSVSFGYRESTTVPAPDYSSAANFVGFPEDVASALGLHLANASCPGETSTSFLNASAQSNGCENHVSATGAFAAGGYRSLYPLHVSYTGSQMAYALQYLKAHPRTSLITLMIGANDGFICQEITTDQCASPTELAPVLATVTKNVAIILHRLRVTADFKGQIVLVNYYSTNYSNALASAGSQAINQALDQGAAGFNVEIANGYAAFNQAAQYSAGNSCNAGLLTQLYTSSTMTGCGVHPSVGGQAILAQTVESVVHK